MCVTGDFRKVQKTQKPRRVWKLVTDSHRSISALARQMGPGELIVRSPQNTSKFTLAEFRETIEHYFHYKVGKAYKSPMPASPGLYCYETLKNAQRAVQTWNYLPLKFRILECSVPKNTAFVLGQDCHYVHCINVARLRVVSARTATGRPTSAKPRSNPNA